MIMRFPKGSQVKLSDNFSILEFHCHCALPGCDFTYIDTDLILALEKLRMFVGPMRILSGFRCSRHNEMSGGKPGSFHLTGKAVDVAAHCKPSYLALQAEQIMEFRNGGVGRYFSFSHLDIRGYRARWEKKVVEIDHDDPDPE